MNAFDLAYDRCPRARLAARRAKPPALAQHQARDEPLRGHARRRRLAVASIAPGTAPLAARAALARAAGGPRAGNPAVYRALPWRASELLPGGIRLVERDVLARAVARISAQHACRARAQSHPLAAAWHSGAPPPPPQPRDDPEHADGGRARGAFARQRVLRRAAAPLTHDASALRPRRAGLARAAEATRHLRGPPAHSVAPLSLPAAGAGREARVPRHPAVQLGTPLDRRSSHRRSRRRDPLPPPERRRGARAARLVEPRDGGHAARRLRARGVGEHAALDGPPQPAPFLRGRVQDPHAAHLPHGVHRG